MSRTKQQLTCLPHHWRGPLPCPNPGCPAGVPQEHSLISIKAAVPLRLGRALGFRQEVRVYSRAMLESSGGRWSFCWERVPKAAERSLPERPLPVTAR